METVQALGGIGELAKLIGNYGVGVICLAVLLALHVYNVRVTMPGLIDGARKQIDDLSRVHREQLEKLAADFDRNLAENRQQCHEDHLRMAEILMGCQRAITDNQTAIIRLIDRFDKLNPK